MAREQEEGDEKVCGTEIGVYGMWERERPIKVNWSDSGRPVHTLASSCIHSCIACMYVDGLNYASSYFLHVCMCRCTHTYTLLLVSPITCSQLILSSVCDHTAEVCMGLYTQL